jgi:hypothetical protein
LRQFDRKLKRWVPTYRLGPDGFWARIKAAV